MDFYRIDATGLRNFRNGISDDANCTCCGKRSYRDDLKLIKSRTGDDKLLCKKCVKKQNMGKNPYLQR